MSRKDLELKDLRVPTFIPLNSDGSSVKKAATKRKRGKGDPKPARKKTLKKSDVLDDFYVFDLAPKEIEENDPFVKIWIGAVIEEDNGAFCVYFGENDERNCSQVFVRDSQLQDEDFGYVLGTLKAIEIIGTTDTPFIINTSCRDLPLAIEGKSTNAFYQDSITKIRELIQKRTSETKVRHISGRKAPEEQKIAIDLASKALIDSKQQVIPMDDQIPDMQIEAFDTTIINTEIITHEEPVENEDDEDASSEKLVLEETNETVRTVSQPSEDVQEEIVEEIKVETTIETHYEAQKVDQDVVRVEEDIKIEEEVKIEQAKEAEEVISMEGIEETSRPPLTTSSSWTSAFSGLWDTLTSPFRKSQQ
ncbi:uncharacterized protein B0P05DRAFT_565805 [Gilbertella persicaria]|nr:uncharacterized protein B0P05DRAFT_565805 [Gilbertella persicaria]KAI8047521.1 hypothetical protein B0P05DRAFT_565805 [Gilbertella persicaria]